MKLIVGLGNPGKKYEKTRHNIGEELLRGFAFSIDSTTTFKKQRELHAEIAQISVGSEKVLLAFPTTYMNDSGKAVYALLRYYKISPSDLIILHDDLDLALGKAKIVTEGRSAGHNGVQAIYDTLKTEQITRVRIGIGKPVDKTTIPDYVLQRFTKEEMAILTQKSDDLLRTLSALISQPLTEVIKTWNGVLGEIPTNRSS